MTSHSVVLASLTEGRTYHYQVSSTDASSNTATATASTFTTPVPAPPAISGVSVTYDPTGTSATVAWTTDKAATSRVDYGLSALALSSSVESTVLVTSHGLVLTGLERNTTYYYRITSVADGKSASYPSATGASSFTTPLTSFTDTTKADFDAGTPDTNVVDAAGRRRRDLAEAGGGLGGVRRHRSAGGLGLDAQLDRHDGLGGRIRRAHDRRRRARQHEARHRRVRPRHGDRVRRHVRRRELQHVGFGAGDDSRPTASGVQPGSVGLVSTAGDDEPQRARLDGLGERDRSARRLARGRTATGSSGTRQRRVLRGRRSRRRASTMRRDDHRRRCGSVRATTPPAARPLARRLDPHPPVRLPSGTFLSRVWNAGAPVNWGTFAWTASTPDGHDPRMAVRSGNTPNPDDGTWTPFVPIAAPAARRASSASTCSTARSSAPRHEPDAGARAGDRRPDRRRRHDGAGGRQPDAGACGDRASRRLGRRRCSSASRWPRPRSRRPAEGRRRVALRPGDAQPQTDVRR